MTFSSLINSGIYRITNRCKNNGTLKLFSKCLVALLTEATVVTKPVIKPGGE